MKMNIEQCSEEINSNSGIYLIAGQINKLKSLKMIDLMQKKARKGQAKDSDIIKMATALFALGKTDYAAIKLYEKDDFFRDCLHLSKVVSEASLRQRLGQRKFCRTRHPIFRVICRNYIITCSKKRNNMNEIMKIMGGPTILIFIGAILAAVGAVWASIDQNKYNSKLNEKNEEIAELSRSIVDSVTGGKTICYFTPLSNNPSDVAVSSKGGYPLYDLTARIVDLEEFDKKPNDKQNYENVIDLKGLSPKAAMPLGSILKLYGETRRWNIFFSARNGFFTQQLRMKKINGKWVKAIRVTRSAEKDVGVAYEKVDDQYPCNSSGQVEW